MKKAVKTKKTGRKVVVKIPPKKSRKDNLNGPSLSDGGFSDQFGSHKAPVLHNNMDTVNISLSAQGESAPLLQSFPNPNDPMTAKPFAVLADFANDGGTGAGNVTVDHAAPMGDITTDTLVSNVNATASKIPWWGWGLAIVIVITAVVYISKKK